MSQTLVETLTMPRRHPVERRRMLSHYAPHSNSLEWVEGPSMLLRQNLGQKLSMPTIRLRPKHKAIGPLSRPLSPPSRASHLPVLERQFSHHAIPLRELHRIVLHWDGYLFGGVIDACGVGRDHLRAKTTETEMSHLKVKERSFYPVEARALSFYLKVIPFAHLDPFLRQSRMN